MATSQDSNDRGSVSRETPASDLESQSIEERLDYDELSELRRIRRAAAGVEACSQILIAHMINEASLPARPSVFIALEPDQAMGLAFAMEACAGRILGGCERRFDFTYTDEIRPDVTAEAVDIDALRRGETTLELVMDRHAGRRR